MWCVTVMCVGMAEQLSTPVLQWAVVFVSNLIDLGY